VLPATAALIRSICSLSKELVRTAEGACPITNTYLIVEWGDGSATSPYRGEVVKCGGGAMPVDLEEEFKQAWWVPRRRSLGDSPVVNRDGSGTPTKRSVVSVRTAAGSPSSGCNTGDEEHSHNDDGDMDDCPALSLHGVDVLAKAKQSTGWRSICDAEVANVLAAVGLAKVNQLNATRVRRIFQRLSRRINPPGKPKTQVSYSQVCPLELLMNKFKTSKTGALPIESGCLYPPWSNAIKNKHKERAMAVIIAATQSDVWLYMLCKEMGVPWTPDLRSKINSDAVTPAKLQPLTKKRPSRAEQGSGKGIKKPRVVSSTKRNEGLQGPASDQASIEAEAGGGLADDAGASVGTGDGTAAAGTPLTAVLRGAEQCTLRALAEMQAVSEINLESSVLENMPVNAEQRLAAEAASKDVAILLPYAMVSQCLEYYPNHVDSIASSASEPILNLSSTSLPPTTLTRTSVMNMLTVHSHNADVRKVRAAYEWLRGLAASTAQFEPNLGRVLSPVGSVAQVAREVNDLLDGTRVGDDAWRFFDCGVSSDGDEAGSRAYGGQTVTIREVAAACQRSWLTSDVINGLLVELRLEMRLSRSYVLLTNQMASLLRIGDQRVSLAAARKAAAEIAIEAGDCNELGIVVNLGNVHWVSAVVDISKRKIVMYDSKPGVAGLEREMAESRVQLLCDAVVQRQTSADSIAMLCSDSWGVTRLDTPNQGDDCSCGVFAVANVFCSLTGFNLSASRPDGDLLRLALVHHLLYRGQVYSRARGAGRVETNTM